MVPFGKAHHLKYMTVNFRILLLVPENYIYQSDEARTRSKKQATT